MQREPERRKYTRLQINHLLGGNGGTNSKGKRICRRADVAPHDVEHHFGGVGQNTTKEG